MEDKMVIMLTRQAPTRVNTVSRTIFDEIISQIKEK